MFETIHCKNHKIDGETFHPIKWQFRYPNMKIITANRNVQLLDSEEEFIEKTTKDGCYSKLKLQCNICLEIVTHTSIDSFVNQGKFGCSCNTINPWCKEYKKFLVICKNNNTKLLDSEEIYIEKTKKDAQSALLKLQCNICNDIVITTNIKGFVGGSLGCSCNNKTPWSERLEEFLEICKNNNVKLLDNVEIYIEKTLKDGVFAYITLKCLECNTNVTTTTIDNFVQGRLGCNCNRIIWNRNYEKFLEICKNNNAKLIDNKKEYTQKTTKDGCDTYLNLQCLICNESVNTTTIDAFTHGKLGCYCCKYKSEKCLGEILKDIFPEYEFKKIRPDWLNIKNNNNKRFNLELDYYNEELKLAFEYQGLQHEQYVPFHHNKDINNFYKQQEHDRIKKEVCEKRGIKLICIPSKYDYTNPLEMCDFILENL